MATSVICLKVTPAEIDLIDSTLAKANLHSRSEALRYAIVLLAERWGVPRNFILAAGDERAEHPPKRRQRHRGKPQRGKRTLTR